MSFSSLFYKMKSPQLSKPKVTVARNQNSLCDKMEKKPDSKDI